LKKLDLEVTPLGNPAMKMPMMGMHMACEPGRHVAQRDGRRDHAAAPTVS
jgi:hypothetical protein